MTSIVWNVAKKKTAIELKIVATARHLYFAYDVENQKWIWGKACVTPALVAGILVASSTALAQGVYSQQAGRCAQKGQYYCLLGHAHETMPYKKYVFPCRDKQQNQNCERRD